MTTPGCADQELIARDPPGCDHVSFEEARQESATGQHAFIGKQVTASTVSVTAQIKAYSRSTPNSG